MSLDPKRTVAELKELRALTGNAQGAQRVAFTPLWVAAHQWLRQKLAGLPVEIHTDAAGNLWVTLAGESERALLLGGHLDSVPDGGWLDGCLNVLAGVEVLRRVHQQYPGRPPVTVRLVAWADEEGARFGKSLFASACSGHLDLDEARRLRDRDGVSLPEALRTAGVDFERVKDSGAELKQAAAYLELHIEQGPVLLDLDLPLGAVLGTLLLPTFIMLFMRGVYAFERRGSMLQAALRLFHPRVMLDILRSVKMPPFGEIASFRPTHLPMKLLVGNVLVTGVYAVGVVASFYASVLDLSARTTATGLSGLVNGFGTVCFSFFVDPTTAYITDQAVKGERSPDEVRTMVFWLAVTAILGWLLSQLILIPGAYFIAAGANVFHPHP